MAFILLAGFWESLGGLPSAIAILASAGAGAYLAWRYHRHVSALRATLDFVTATEVASSEWKAAQLLFRRLFPGDANPRPDYSGQIVPTMEGEVTVEAKDVVTISIYLGHFEFVAAAINHDAMDEDLYKAWNKTVVINTWSRAERYVMARREKTGQESLYQDFQKLAEKWMQE